MNIAQPSYPLSGGGAANPPHSVLRSFLRSCAVATLVYTAACTAYFFSRVRCATSDTHLKKNKKLSHAPDAFPNLKQQLEEGQTEMQEPYEDYLDVECEDESTDNTPAPSICKSCGGERWRSGRKDAAQLSRRNEILNEVRELFDAGKSEEEALEHFGGERNRYINIDRYVRMFFRRHAREKK